MASTSTERSRRLRKHRAGDHSLCSPERCDATQQAVADTVASVATPPATPPELHARGRRLWREVTNDGGELKPAERVLLEEACRLADRLDVLDRLLRGEDREWARLAPASLDGSVVRIVVDGLLSETRQQQVAFKQLLAELRQSRAVGKTVGSSGGQQPPSQTLPGGASVPGGVTDLTARIAERRNQTAR